MRDTQSVATRRRAPRSSWEEDSQRQKCWCACATQNNNNTKTPQTGGDNVVLRHEKPKHTASGDVKTTRTTNTKSFASRRALPWVSRAAIAVAVLLAQLSLASAAPFGNAAVEEEDPRSPDYASLARDAMASASTADFDAAATLRQIRASPAVQEKMRAMLSDPKALAELSELMKDPAFKAQVEAFAGNPEVADALRAKGAAAFLGDQAAVKATPSSKEDARKEAQRRAEAELEYEHYAAQFTGEENAATGLRHLVAAAKDQNLLADALRDLNDPQMMASARDMMADPAFQAEMKRMMEQPEMRHILDASRNFVQDLAKDPQKMKQVQDRVAKLAASASLSEL